MIYMKKTIKFVAKDKYGWTVQPRPEPAATILPAWWTSMTPYVVEPKNPDGKKLFLKARMSNATYKKCTPMLDALTSGYILSLYADVLVRRVEGFAEISWKVERDVFQTHGINASEIPPPLGYENSVFKYANTWIPVTPSGYSVLITSPFGYKDLPFHAVPAVVDSDKSKLELLPPMWLKKDFEGVVEKGTPLVQITPFKRDSWVSEFSYLEEDEYLYMEENSFNKTLVNHYIKNVWSKKQYK